MRVYDCDSLTIVGIFMMINIKQQKDEMWKFLSSFVIFNLYLL